LWGRQKLLEKKLNLYLMEMMMKAKDEALKYIATYSLFSMKPSV
jgi:hypothetical protein